MMILIIGEILIDELPGGARPGGAPFNVAQHLTRLGHKTGLVSRLGTDTSGDFLLGTMRRLGMDTRFLQQDSMHKTGCVKVELSGAGIPCYTIPDNVAYDYIDFETLDLDIASCALVCFGSLMQRSEPGCRRLQNFLTSLPDHVLRLYDMNLRPGCDHAGVVFPSLEQTDVLKINDEELEHTGRLLGTALKGDDLVHRLVDQFNIQTIALTLGAAGSILYTGSGKYEVSATPLKAEEIADTVGAGDSFTAVLAHGLIRGYAPAEILEKASRLAGRMCTVHGAVPENESIYKGIE